MRHCRISPVLDELHRREVHLVDVARKHRKATAARTRVLSARRRERLRAISCRRRVRRFCGSGRDGREVRLKDADEALIDKVVARHVRAADHSLVTLHHLEADRLHEHIRPHVLPAHRDDAVRLASLHRIAPRVEQLHVVADKVEVRDRYSVAVRAEDALLPRFRRCRACKHV